MDPSATWALHSELVQTGIEFDPGQDPHDGLHSGLTSFEAARFRDGMPCWVHVLAAEPRSEVWARLNELSDPAHVSQAGRDLLWDIRLLPTTLPLTVVLEERAVAPAILLADEVSDRPRDWADLMIRLMPVCDALARLASPERSTMAVTHGDVRVDDLYYETTTGQVRLGGFVRGALRPRVGEVSSGTETLPDTAALIDVLTLLATPPDDAIASCRAAVQSLGGQPYAAALALKEAFRNASQQRQAVVVDTDVQFSLYRPRAIQPGRWHSVLAFAHKTELVRDEFGAVVDPVTQVEAQAAALLASENTPYSSVRTDSGTALGRGADLTFELWLQQAEVNPPRAHLRWQEAIHRVEFRVRTMTAPAGARLAGGLRVFSGHLLIGETRFALEVSVASLDTATTPDEPTEAEAVRRYRKIFASYSHRDADVVAAVRRFSEVTGDRYMVDADTLRSGEAWSDRLSELIEAADVFQLFWSENSMRSPHVRREWEHALSLGREHFVRPVYWEQPFPEDRERGLPPETLLMLHFSSLSPVPMTRPGSGVWGAQLESLTFTFCGTCGEKVPLDMQFCWNCGNYLRSAHQPPAPDLGPAEMWATTSEADPDSADTWLDTPRTATTQAHDLPASAPTSRPPPPPPTASSTSARPTAPSPAVYSASAEYKSREPGPPAPRRRARWPVAAGIVAVVVLIIVVSLIVK